MKIAQKSATAIASLATLLGFSFGVAPLASAAPSCASGHVCLWDTSNFGGDTVSMTAPSSGCKTIPYAWAKNILSSAYNNSSHDIFWYDGDGCTGAYLFSMSHPSYTAQLGSSVNNRANS